MVMKKYYYNIDFLRFIIIWGVVLYHLIFIPDVIKPFGFQRYFNLFIQGRSAVDMFFFMSGFFEFVNVDVSINTIEFIKKKWLRLAPLLIVVTLLYWVMNILSQNWNFNYSANFLSCLLIKTWTTWPIWGEAVSPAWYIHELFFISIIYFYLFKNLSNVKANIAIFIVSFIGLRVSILGDVLPKYGMGIMDSAMAEASMWMGIGYFLAQYVKISPPPPHTHRLRVNLLSIRL
jgi:peptidoglycan/LPS O-acetylase OafA/YrhL